MIAIFIITYLRVMTVNNKDTFVTFIIQKMFRSIVNLILIPELKLPYKLGQSIKLRNNFEKYHNFDDTFHSTSFNKFKFKYDKTPLQAKYRENSTLNLKERKQKKKNDFKQLQYFVQQINYLVAI